MKPFLFYLSLCALFTYNTVQLANANINIDEPVTHTINVERAIDTAGYVTVTFDVTVNETDIDISATFSKQINEDTVKVIENYIDYKLNSCKRIFLQEGKDYEQCVYDSLNKLTLTFDIENF